MKKLVIFLIFIVIIFLGLFYFLRFKAGLGIQNTSLTKPTVSPQSSNPLTIVAMRQKSYPGSAISMEKTLASFLTNKEYLVSYKSEGLKIYGELTVPTGKMPSGGWPVILFNHGYIPPAQYSTESSYASFVRAFSSAGYIVFKPDYRGNGSSEGEPKQPYIAPDYITDSMNAFYSIKQFSGVNTEKIGVFGHSMGGNIALHQLTMTKDVKAAVIMSGVVGDETQILDWWESRIRAKSIIGNDLDTYYVVEQMMKDHGRPDSNPEYWNAIDPIQFISGVTVPIQIQVGTADTAVPVSFSTSFYEKLKGAYKSVEYKEYTDADHNLSPYTTTALHEAVTFFNKYLK